MAKEVIPPSPEAAALGQYGNVPVGLFTGTPTISIPLYELKGNSISLPISISYNASGFKPEDEATWCGSSWSLNAGGVITRAVRGNPDNSSNYFGVANVLNPPSSSDFFGQDTYLKNIQDGIIETQPDIYYYNFAGHSGKFLVKPDNTVFKKEKDLKAITFGSGFTIVDEQGITYVFDVDETSIMTPSDDFGQSSTISYTYPSAWYLRSMISAAGDEVIEFEYHTNLSGSIQNGNRLNNRSVSYTYGVKAPNTYCASPVDQSPIYTLPPPEVLIHRKFLKKIIYKRSNIAIAYVDILSATGQRQDTEDTYARRLNQVKVYSTNNTTDKLIKQYDFTYGYFFNNVNVINKRRLRLESLQEISVDGVTPSPPAYTFTYDATPIPERFTASLDHWGFYNAAGNTSLVPYVYFPGVLVDFMYFQARNIGEGANREADFSGSATTILNKMTYPTGGYTTFEYELNEAKFDDGLYHPVGGVRVKKITDYSFNGVAARAKTYTYLSDDGTGSGRSGIFPFYQTTSSYHHYFIPFQSAPCEIRRENEEYFLYTITVSANSIFSLGSFQGSHLGYTQVTESQTDLVNNQTLGKTVYNYSFNGAFANDENIENGDLVRQRVYRNDGKLLQEISNTYNTTTGDVLNSVMAKPLQEQTNKAYYCRTSTNWYYPYGDWEAPPAGCVEFRTMPTVRYPETSSFFQQNKRMTQTIIKVYDEIRNEYLVTTKDLFYDNPLHNYATRIEETTSNGSKLKTDIKYVVDYAAAPTATTGSIAYNIDLMRQKNIVGLPVEKLQYRQDAGGGNTRYISGQITDYIVGKSSKIYFLEAQPLVASVTPSSISSNVFNYDSHYRLAATMKYDANENLIEQSKTDDMPKAYIWDYNNMYPVAEATGAHDNEIGYTSFETTGKGGFTFTGNPVADVSSPTGRQCYNLAGNSISATVDLTKTYILSYWRKNASGSFSVSGSTGGKQGLTKNGWTYFEHIVTGATTLNVSGSGYIDELRLYPTLTLMATRTYDPLIGVLTECDVNNNIAYYTYDGLSRLSNIKDGDGNMVKSFKYNYGLGTVPTQSAQSLFYNAVAQGTFTKVGCSPGSYGEQVTYVVPYGKYAALSPTEANNMAAADITANGQNYANNTGRCYWLSAAINQPMVKTDCPPEQGPGIPWTYTVYGGKYKSFISQADANAQATAEINALPPDYANTYGQCSCADEGRRYINGTCEYGTSITIGGTYENGQWLCTYYYTFSDGYNSGFYYRYQSEPCPIAP
ncbi:hypothetical protein HB364_31160 [Pseudoflavitalea sp. X16]|uniref:DUF5977 domain-containing protein n=1 Tax=Paraflavitalea devenefica TaxID=2716334 RepID=UPI00141EBD96|nr:DUF5977 domain-containing protein [Paraflavitalea devenefica]NII29579.1 hypothetical protein [Paraflavitalea devenefica]